MSRNIFITFSIMFIGVLFSCHSLLPGEPSDDELLDGTIDGLSGSQNAQFLAGDVAFNDEVFTAQTGLGPIFVATSCGSCHAGDGKGHPFTSLTRFGQVDESGNKFLHLGGPQLQHRALPGFKIENIPTGATFSKITPPANTGLGFIELVSDTDILAMADPNDSDGDQISGVPNWNRIPEFVNVPSSAISQNGKYICRFGKKASTFDLLQQTATAYNQDMGITSSFVPHDVLTGFIGDPEVFDNTVRDVVFYLQTLKAPIQRTPNDADVVAGKVIFNQIGCESCHRETLKTGLSPILGLSNKAFHPYTDLLLHDMGPDLDDGYTEGSAKTSEWRTPALWGLGLSTSSQGGQYFLLHDGRARSISQAIEMHGGEGKNSSDKYNLLTTAEKSQLIKFLESL
jgi:CxxC motif-containing protein (DUF1111 family)